MRSPRRFAGWSSTVAMLHRALIAHRRDQDVGDLGPRELDRRTISRAEHLADLRPGKDHTVVFVVRTGLRRTHPLALQTEERVLELQRRDAQLFRLELLEDTLRVVGAVVAADARVVPSYDE